MTDYDAQLRCICGIVPDNTLLYLSQLARINHHVQDIINKLRETRSKTELLLLKHEIENQILALEQQRKQIENDYSDLEFEKVQTAKLIEFNSQSYASFYNTKLEKDKSILTLSVAGLGFLITFTNFANKLSTFSFIAFILSAIAYIICIFNVINIFEKNALYIIEITNDSDKAEELELTLRKHDKIAIYSFYIGILLSFIVGLSTAIPSSEHKEQSMSDQNKNQTSESNDSPLNPIFESFSGITAMKPKMPEKNQSSQRSTPHTNSTEEKNNG